MPTDQPTPASALPSEPHGIVQCANDADPHSLTEECVDPVPAVWTPGAGMALLRREHPGMVPDLTEEDVAVADRLGRLAPADVLAAAADAADDAICRRLDHNQVIALVADAVWRLASERGHAAGHVAAVAAVQQPCQRAYERGKAEGRAELAAEHRRTRAEWTRALAGLIRQLDEEDLVGYMADALDGLPQPKTNGEMMLRVVHGVADRLALSTLGDPMPEGSDA